MKVQRATKFPTDTDFERLAESLDKDIGFSRSGQKRSLQ